MLSNALPVSASGIGYRCAGSRSKTLSMKAAGEPVCGGCIRRSDLVLPGRKRCLSPPSRTDVQTGRLGNRSLVLAHEVLNALLVGEKRKRISGDLLRSFLPTSLRFLSCWSTSLLTPYMAASRHSVANTA